MKDKKQSKKMGTSINAIKDIQKALDQLAIVAITNQHGIILSANKKFCDISKYNTEELIGKDLRILNSSFHSKSYFKDLWETIKQGKSWKGEMRNKAKDGSLFWIAATIVPMLDEKGSPIEYTLICLNITKSKELEAAKNTNSKELELKQLELTQLNDALNKSAIVSMTDAAGKTTFVNDLFCKISGYKRNELIGENHPVLKSEKNPKGLFTEMWKVLHKGNVWQGDITEKKKDGGYYWVKTTIVPFKDLEGKTYKYVDIGFDITEQKRQQELLKNKNEELIIQQEELYNANIELESQTQQLQDSEIELKNQQEELFESNQNLEENTQLLEEKNQSIHEKNKALQAASDEIQQKANEIELASKYKSQFLANMSHELRTPLNSILLLSKLLSNNADGNLNKDQKEFAAVIHKSGNNLLELINEILDLSKIESGKMELDIQNIKVNGVLKNMKDLFVNLAKEKGIRFLIKKEKGVDLELKTDQTRLEQVIKNFLSNAFKFTNKGTIELIIRAPNVDEIFKMNIQPKNYLCFEVKDTGIGIPKDKQNLIFEAFQQADGTTRRKYGGTGLGLSISREISHLLGGEILLKSNSGKGSSFSMILLKDQTKLAASIIIEEKADISKPQKEQDYPVSTSNASDNVMSNIIPNEIPDDRFKLNKNDKVILIIEDDTCFAKALITAIHEKSYKAIIAVTGANAIPYAIKYKPIGILLDVKLPEKNGWTVMKELKENKKTSHIPVHIMSSQEYKSNEVIAMGAVDLIYKPFSEKQLGNVLQKIESMLGNNTKTILLVDENELHTKAISSYLENSLVKCITAKTSGEAYAILKKEKIDCVVLDMGLPDENCYKVLETIKKNEPIKKLPVIIYTGKSISLQAEIKLKKYASAIIVKTADSFTRLSREISLFLHLVEDQEKEGWGIQKNYFLDKTLKGKHVLIVDDDVRNIYSLTKLMETQNMEVSAACDGIEALEKLNKENNIDLVLMDMMMPNKDGYETTKEIRKIKKLKKISIIAVTAKAMLGDRQKCISAGANDYITKPIDGDQLLSLLRVWLFN